jgi:hypothetical protein
MAVGGMSGGCGDSNNQKAPKTPSQKIPFSQKNCQPGASSVNCMNSPGVSQAIYCVGFDFLFNYIGEGLVGSEGLEPPTSCL